MTALCIVAAVVALAWLLNRYWRAPCPNCGHLPHYCHQCAQEAGRRIIAELKRDGHVRSENEAGSTAYLYEGRSEQ